MIRKGVDFPEGMRRISSGEQGITGEDLPGCALRLIVSGTVPVRLIRPGSNKYKGDKIVARRVFRVNKYILVINPVERTHQAHSVWFGVDISVCVGR